MIEACPLLNSSQPPEYWIDELKRRGIIVSLRWLKETATRLGACYRMGRQTLISPTQLDQILET